MGSLRKWKNSTTAPSPCVWQTKADGPCSNNHNGHAEARVLPITSELINNLVFAASLLQINTEEARVFTLG